jgi:hypothetical protein
MLPRWITWEHQLGRAGISHDQRLKKVPGSRPQRGAGSDIALSTRAKLHDLSFDSSAAGFEGPCW